MVPQAWLEQPPLLPLPLPLPLLLLLLLLVPSTLPMSGGPWNAPGFGFGGWFLFLGCAVALKAYRAFMMWGLWSRVEVFGDWGYWFTGQSRNKV